MNSKAIQTAEQLQASDFWYKEHVAQILDCVKQQILAKKELMVREDETVSLRAPPSTGGASKEINDDDEQMQEFFRLQALEVVSGVYYDTTAAAPINMDEDNNSYNSESDENERDCVIEDIFCTDEEYDVLARRNKK